MRVCITKMRVSVSDRLRLQFTMLTTPEVAPTNDRPDDHNN